MSGPLLSLKQAAEYLFGTSITPKEANEKFIKLLCLTDKDLPTQRVLETSPSGKQQPRVKIKFDDLQLFKEKIERKEV
jgi:hypothetical protein